MFSADNVEQWEQIRRTIDSSDYYVLVIKRRYGSMTKDGISYTEKEYNYAKEKKIPVLAFVAARDAAITNSDIEDDPEKLLKIQVSFGKIQMICVRKLVKHCISNLRRIKEEDG